MPTRHPLDRDIAIALFVGAFVFFLIGFAIGTSKGLGMAIVWGLAVAQLLVSLSFGARAVLVEVLGPKR